MKLKISEKILLLLGVICLLLGTLPAHAQDNFVPQCATQASCQLNQFGPISWASGNQVWRFIPVNPNVTIRIWIRNRNTTSAHTSQTVNVFVTDESNAPNFLLSQDRWVQAVVTNNTVVGAQCTNLAVNNPLAVPGGKGACYSNNMYASQVAIQITGAAGAVGTPDTFDIGVVQQTGSASGPQPGADSSTQGIWSSNSSPMGAAAFTGADGFLNVGFMEPCIGINTAVNCGIMPVGSWAFNGATWDRVIQCNKTTFISALGATTTQIIALSGTTKIRICSATFSNTNATATQVKLVEGTGVNCAAGQTQLTGNIGLGVSPSAFTMSQVMWITNVAGDALCATGSAAGAVDITVTWAQY